MTETKAQERVLARATVNLSGLSSGAKALVDPSDRYTKMLLKNGYLVPVGKQK